MQAFVVTVDVEQAELLADVLFRHGAAAVEERPISAGVVELWTHVGDAGGDVERAVAQLPPHTRWRAETVDESAANRWRDHATPIWVSPEVLIAPAWKPAPDVDAGVLVLAIDPGAAFGLGDHPTTVLTMQSLLARAAAGPLGRVLDVGCGSGVLAVAAARLGAEAVVAIDIAAPAVAATVDNARRNGVADRVEVSTAPLGEVDGQFDLVLANILAPTIVELADDLVRVTGAGGQLTISGLLTGDEPRMADVLAPLERAGSRARDGWAAVEFTQRADA